MPAGSLYPGRSGLLFGWPSIGAELVKVEMPRRKRMDSSGSLEYMFAVEGGWMLL